MGFVHHKAVKTELFKGKRGIFREESLIVLNINPRNTDTGGYIASFEFRRQNGRQSRYVPLIIGIVLCIEFSGAEFFTDISRLIFGRFLPTFNRIVLACFKRIEVYQVVRFQHINHRLRLLTAQLRHIRNIHFTPCINGNLHSLLRSIDVGNLGGILDGTLGEEIGLFNSLFLLVNDFQSTQRVVVIVLAENLFVCAVVNITEYEPPAPL